MKKRLRKKLRLGEFRELGFFVAFDFSGNGDSEKEDRFWNDFVLETIEKNQLFCGGGGAKRRSFFITKERGSVSEEERSIVAAFLENDPLVDNIFVGSLVDAWR